MTACWKAELERLKRLPTEETNRVQKKEVSVADSHKDELKKLMALLKSQLVPVVEVFREKGKTKTQQPHIHEHNDGYTLVLPVAEKDIKPIILRLQFEFSLTENGYVLKTIGETEKNAPAPEKIIEAPFTEERMRDEIRDFLRRRRNIILKLKKRKTT